MDHGVGHLVERSNPRSAVQGTFPEELGALDGGRDREIPRLRLDPRDWPVYAQRLVKAFGKDVFDIIEAAPERLREVTGIGPMRATKITAGWADQKVIREIMVFLCQHGVGTARAVRIFKTYGTDAAQVMSENPYRLAKDIRGIGFRTADTIAEKLGIEKTAMIRLRAGISFALTEAMGDGYCGLPRAELIGLTGKLLEVRPPLIENALQEELAAETGTADSVGDADCIFLTRLYLAERGISEHVKRIRDRGRRGP